MVPNVLKQCTQLAIACAASVSLGGCLISSVTGSSSGGVFSGTATVELQDPAPCTPNTTSHTTTCDVLMHAALPSGAFGVDFPITLVGWESPLALWDPLIVQVPATMSGFSGSITGPAGTTALDITAGLASLPIDKTTNLVAEPGMQLVVLDYPASAPPAKGTYTMNFQFTGTASSIKVMFAAKVTAGAVAEAKAAQTYYLPIYPCVANFAAVTPITLPISASQIAALVFGAAGQGCASKGYDFTGLAPGGGGPAAVTVVEYYNATLDHYFITWAPAEQANLDAGNTPTKWVRTGYSFKAYTTASAGTSPVCRFYIPPGYGDSHFFGRGTQECDDTHAKFPQFVREDPAFMQMFLPSAGVCPAGTMNVYRVFSGRADANHRYMTDKTVRDQMAAKGWVVEGDGPDAVVMCAPL